MVGGEVGATSSLAPKIGPLGLVSTRYLITNSINNQIVIILIMTFLLFFVVSKEDRR